MTADDRFDRDLEGWLEAIVPTRAPAGLHNAAIDRVRGTRQRPAWLVALRGDTIGSSVQQRYRPGLAVVYLVVLFALVFAIVVAAIVAGAFRADPAKLGHNGAIAYSVRDFSQRNQPESLHLIQPGGTDRPVGFGSCPNFSKDGSVLAYFTGSFSTTQLNVARPDGSSPHVVPGIGESGGALAPDGTEVASFKDLAPITSPDGNTTLGSKDELWLTPVAGGPAIRIVPASVAPNDSYSSPVWSPDGRRIAFAINVSLFSAGGGADGYRSAIIVVDSDGSNLRTLTTRAGTDEISWSPDGRDIAFIGFRDGSPLPSLGVGSDAAASLQPPPTDIFVVSVDGEGERHLTNSPTNEYSLEWSPDGTGLAYQTDQDGGRLAIVRMDGAAAVGSPILGPPNGLTWSPDGTKVLLLEAVATDPSVDPSVIPQSIRSRIKSVDAAFQQAPATLVASNYDIPCSPSWQRVAP